MNSNYYKLLLLGGAVRLYFSQTSLAPLIGNRVEFATPLNSFKRRKYADMPENIYTYPCVKMCLFILHFFSARGRIPASARCGSVQRRFGA